jgi:hypothetical protein
MTTDDGSDGYDSDNGDTDFSCSIVFGC